jgi:glycosyltransferase involved in cell wall biosynthesis
MIWPKISIVIPTRGIKGDNFLNSEKYIKRCLDSVYKQNYPKAKLEVFVVDGGSTDNTLEIARRYPVKILNNPKKLAEPAKTLGYKHATGEFFLYLDSDAELVSSDWFKKIITPLLVDETLAGSFTRYSPGEKQTAFNRYVSFNPLQLWSMLSYLLPSIEDVTIANRKGYRIIKVYPQKCPPVGICLYRKRWLDEVITDPERFNYVDIAIPIQLAELGHDKFAYVATAGLYHRRGGLRREMLRLKRDVIVTYLPVIGERKFNYIDFSKPLDILKIILWVLWVDSIIPSLVVGIYKTFKYKDTSGLYELPTNFLLTNYIIILFLIDPNGRKLVRRIILGR